MEVIEFITRQDEAGERLDALIARRVPQLTRSRIQQLMEQGLVQAGGRPAAKSLRAVQDMPVRIEVPDAQPRAAQSAGHPAGRRL